MLKSSVRGVDHHASGKWRVRQKGQRDRYFEAQDAAESFARRVLAPPAHDIGAALEALDWMVTVRADRLERLYTENDFLKRANRIRAALNRLHTDPAPCLTEAEALSLAARIDHA